MWLSPSGSGLLSVLRRKCARTQHTFSLPGSLLHFSFSFSSSFYFSRSAVSRPFPSGIVVLRLRLPCRAVCQFRIGIKARHELIGPAGQTAHYNAQQSPTAGVKRAQYLLIIYSSSLSVPLCPSLTHSLAFAFTLFLLFFVGTSLFPLCFFFSLLFLDFFLFLPFSSTIPFF